MKEETIFRLPSLYRDDFRVKAYTFGDGSNDVAVVGAMRGNEYQQLYTASKLIQRLKELELKNRIIKGHSITVIPCVNPSSMNIHKRFWPIDNTDINRMFPGYDRGETTQRIAAALFDRVKDSRINTNRHGTTANIFGTLQTRIGRNNTKMRTKYFSIASTATSVTFKHTLNLKSLPKGINSGSSSTRQISSTLKSY